MASTDVVVEAFTELAPRYEETVDRELWQYFGVRYRDFIRRLLEIVPCLDGGVVLDLATGTARIPLAMVEHRAQEGPIIGLDITPAMLSCGHADVESRNLGSWIRLVCASATGMPFVKGLFDVVICGLAMHHMDVPAVLYETRRVLKPGGYLVVAAVRKPSLWQSPVAKVLLWIAALVYGLLHRTARAKAEMAAIPNLRTADEWLAILSDSGFPEVELMTTFPSRRPWYPGAVVLRASTSRA